MEVHPPEHAIHNWRDVLIHLGIVTLGLLIALSLEALVEYIHHRHQVRETRENLEAEKRENEESVHSDIRIFRKLNGFLHEDVRVLRFLKQHPATPADKLPGKLVFVAGWQPLQELEWHTAMQTGATALMDQREVVNISAIYVNTDQLNTAWDVVVHHIFRLGGFQHVDPDPAHLSPKQIDDLLEGCGVAIGELQVVAAELSNWSHAANPDKPSELNQDEVLGIDR